MTAIDLPAAVFTKMAAPAHAGADSGHDTGTTPGPDVLSGLIVRS